MSITVQQALLHIMILWVQRLLLELIALIHTVRMAHTPADQTEICTKSIVTHAMDGMQITVHTLRIQITAFFVEDTDILTRELPSINEYSVGYVEVLFKGNKYCFC